MNDEMRAQIDQLISVTHQQKGELLYLQTLLLALLRSIPPELQSVVIAQFDRQAEIARKTLLFSDADDAVAEAFEHYVSALSKRQG